MTKKMSKTTLTCPYCKGEATYLESSAVIYGGRDYGPRYYCEPCDAHVGCHRGTKEPLGRLANAELRALRTKAHAAFDPLWKAKMRIAGWPKARARNAAYKWLAEELDVPPEKCHIGMFDKSACKAVISLCAPFLQKTQKA